jgi:predicted Zn-dependent peptidase
VALSKNKTEQAHFTLGVRALSRDHPDRHALSLLHVILGANMSSRLFREVREKRGLAYEIGSQLKLFEDTGVFAVHAGVEPTKCAQAIALVLRELEKVSRRPVPLAEFRRAREYYSGQLQMGLEDTADHMVWVGENLISYGKIRTLNEILEEMERTQPDDVRRVAGEVLRRDRMCLSAIGPFRKRDEASIRRLLEV